MMRVKVPVIVVVLMLLLLMMISVLAGMTVTMVTTVRNGLVGLKIVGVGEGKSESK